MWVKLIVYSLNFGNVWVYYKGLFMNNTIASASAEQTNSAERLPYSSPELKVFGQLRELTDGGSGTLNEGAMMTAINRMV